MGWAGGLFEIWPPTEYTPRPLLSHLRLPVPLSPPSLAQPSPCQGLALAQSWALHTPEVPADFTQSCTWLFFWALESFWPPLLPSPTCSPPPQGLGHLSWPVQALSASQEAPWASQQNQRKSPGVLQSRWPPSRELRRLSWLCHQHRALWADPIPNNPSPAGACPERATGSLSYLPLTPCPCGADAVPLLQYSEPSAHSHKQGSRAPSTRPAWTL